MAVFIFSIFIKIKRIFKKLNVLSVIVLSAIDFEFSILRTTFVRYFVRNFLIRMPPLTIYQIALSL